MERLTDWSSSRLLRLVASALLIVVLRTEAALRCPEKMPYDGCTCEEDPFRVNCTNNNFTHIPDDLPDSMVMIFSGNNIEILDSVPYPNLQVLYLRNNNIKIIRDGAFKELAHVKTLVLADNNIREITPNTFEGMKELVVLMLDNNKLYEVPNYAFRGKQLQKLEIVQLSNCTLYNIKPHAFHMLDKLVLLNLSNNHLRTVPELSHADYLYKLTHLDLSHNEITRAIGFENLPFLQNIFLHHNHIRTIGDHDFRGLDKAVVTLVLSDNRLNYTDPQAFIRLSRLQTLDLSNNELRDIVWEEMPWETLVQIILHHNPWNCVCANSWMIESEPISTHNNNSNFKCASPPSVAGQPVLLAPRSVFLCPRRSHGINTTVLVGILLLLSFTVAGIGAFVLCRCVRKRKGTDSGSSTPTSAYKRVHEDQGELILRT